MAETAARLPQPLGSRTRVLAWLQRYGVYASVLALFLFNVAFTPHFLEVANFRTQLIQVAPIVIVSLGMALVIGTEGIDLSVGSVMALSSAMVVLYLGYGAPVAIVAALAAGAAVGAGGERSSRTPGCSRSSPRSRCWSASAAWPTCWSRSSPSFATPR
ncbi:ABC transporter permease [Phytohabitans houttuyneae]|uniref:Autoinducer 2 import system permease protein LsrD n=1 Tax=Phytohabitans houttuyneae TaxID=1076126 RepID=A0A6V8KGV3_9ACTN|nr:ABC transporter permease [Phytohabitans houttuyneae]GFJ83064.1 hypothetical protein Phou_072440 [Phytohabitans houttuyneae]